MGSYRFSSLIRETKSVEPCNKEGCQNTASPFLINNSFFHFFLQFFLPKIDILHDLNATIHLNSPSNEFRG